MVQDEFKQVVDWSNLTKEDLRLEIDDLKNQNLRSFIILVALKLQQMISEKEENQAVIDDITAKYKASMEKVLEYELKFEMYQEK